MARYFALSEEISGRIVLFFFALRIRTFAASDFGFGR
jgi:hypothetical protein